MNVVLESVCQCNPSIISQLLLNALLTIENVNILNRGGAKLDYVNLLS